MSIFPTSPPHSLFPSTTNDTLDERVGDGEMERRSVFEKERRRKGAIERILFTLSPLHPLTPSLSLTPSLLLSISLSLLLSLIILPTQTHAQFSAPELSFETTGIISSSGTTPFWLQSNRHGMFSGEGSQFLTRLQAHSTNNQLTDNLSLSYGADFIARPGVNSTASFNQGYIGLEALGIYLKAGRFNFSTPEYNRDLGLGSLGVSGNASPIPQIQMGLKDWISIPFSKDFVQIRGHIVHGWLGSRRYADNILYHEKVGLARFGGNYPLNLYGGLQHYAVWGGRNHPTQGDLPSSIEDFGRVFFVIEGGSNAPITEQQYMLGGHTGVWDFGFLYEINEFKIRGYRHFPLSTKDNLKFKSPQDALTGININFKESSKFSFKEILYEFLYTKWQDGPPRENVIDGVPCSELPDGTCRDLLKGNEDYYNNGLYRTGHTYLGNTIGNPLFLTDNRIERGVLNNRIVAHHIGILNEINNLIIKSRFTYSRNYGTWRRPFESKETQVSISFELEMKTTIKRFPVTFMIEPSYDQGNFVGTQFGVLTGFRLNLNQINRF